MKGSHPHQQQHTHVGVEQALTRPARIFGFAINALLMMSAWAQTLLAGVSGAVPGAMLLCVILVLLWQAYFPRQ